VHVDAIGAAIHLGGAQLDHVQQGLVEAAVAKVGLQGRHRFEAPGGDLPVFHPPFHFRSPFTAPNHMALPGPDELGLGPGTDRLLIDERRSWNLNS
jgi:hypothetical protein